MPRTHDLRGLLGMVAITAAITLAGCSTPPQSARSAAGGDDLEWELSGDRDSTMLERLREQNRRAEMADREEDLAMMRLELADVERELADARTSGVPTGPLEARRDNLQRTIRQEERLLGAGER